MTTRAACNTPIPKQHGVSTGRPKVASDADVQLKERSGIRYTDLRCLQDLWRQACWCSPSRPSCRGSTGSGTRSGTWSCFKATGALHRCSCCVRVSVRGTLYLACCGVVKMKSSSGLTLGAAHTIASHESPRNISLQSVCPDESLFDVLSKVGCLCRELYTDLERQRLADLSRKQHAIGQPSWEVCGIDSNGSSTAAKRQPPNSLHGLLTVTIFGNKRSS